MNACAQTFLDAIETLRQLESICKGRALANGPMHSVQNDLACAHNTVHKQVDGVKLNQLRLIVRAPLYVTWDEQLAHNWVQYTQTAQIQYLVTKLNPANNKIKLAQV